MAIELDSSESSANLSEIESSAVVVECSFEEFICLAPEFGSKTRAENAKNLFRSLLALQQDYRPQWIFAGDRASAEQVTFHWVAALVGEGSSNQEKGREASET